MTAVFKSTGVYVEEKETSGYWLPPELMKEIMQMCMSRSRRTKVAKIFGDESLLPDPEGPIGINGLQGPPGFGGNPR